MTTPHTPPAALDVAAIEARAAQVAHALETAQETRVLLAHIAALQAQHAAEVARAEVAELAALRARIDALRSARTVAATATARYGAAWGKAGDALPTPAQSQEIAAALTVAHGAGDALTAAIDALLAPDAPRAAAEGVGR